MILTAKMFSCTRCGFCCHGETTISLDESDQKRMIEVLDMPVEKVRQRYWRMTGRIVQMKTVDGHCIFYKDGCTIHQGRPWRCGQWPLHPSILADENNFHTIADSCPGIKKDLGYKRFCRILQKLMDESVIRC